MLLRGRINIVHTTKLKQEPSLHLGSFQQNRYHLRVDILGIYHLILCPRRSNRMVGQRKQYTKRIVDGTDNFLLKLITALYTIHIKPNADARNTLLQQFYQGIYLGRILARIADKNIKLLIVCHSYLFANHVRKINTR